MSNEVALTQSFQEKVFAKIRDQIGELMSDEDLKKLVDAAVQKAFFEPRIETDTSGYHSRPLNKPPWLIESIMKLLESSVRVQVQAWISEHPEEIKKSIDEVIGKGMTRLVLSYIDDKISGPLFQFAEQLRQKGILG